MPGKFEGNESEEIAEILYDATSNGAYDEESGDIQESGFWTAIFRGVEVVDGELKEAESGGYIVQEDERGFFSYAEYEDDEEMEEEWKRILEHDAEIHDEDDESDDDYYTGRGGEGKDEEEPEDDGEGRGGAGFDSDFGE